VASASLHSDCGTHRVCGYLASDGCSAKGTCFPASEVVRNAYSPGCACDGTEISVTCTGYPSGYISKPLRHTGLCTTSSSDSGVFSPDAGFDSAPVMPPCPASYADALNKQCSQEGMDCSYPEANCICGNSSPPTTTPLWNCYTLAQGCPSSPPGIGSSCAQPSLRCDYGHCSGGAVLDCMNGSWQKGAGGFCPG
jgi:hypothetical protein